MKEVTYAGLNFQSWLLIGILTYVFAVLLIIYARYCFLRRTICPCSNYCLHFSCERKCCQNLVCEYCKMQPILSKPFCCTRQHFVNEPSCLSSFPSVKYQCFLPNCSYCYCLCCEISIEGELYKDPMPYLRNAVQNI